MKKLRFSKITLIMILFVSMLIVPSVIHGYKTYNYNLLIEEANYNIENDNFNEAIVNIKKAINYKNSSKGELNRLIDHVNSIKISKSFFEKGMDNFKNKEYLLAIDNFGKVINEDSDRYILAEEKKIDSKNLFIQYMLVKSKEYAEKDDLNSAIINLDKLLEFYPDNTESLELRREYSNLLEIRNSEIANSKESDVKNSENTNENKTVKKNIVSESNKQNNSVSDNTSNINQDNQNVVDTKVDNKWIETITGENNPNNVSTGTHAIKHGDWIYYTDEWGSFINKIKVDGTNKTKLVSAKKIFSIGIIDNHIVYTAKYNEDNHTIYKMNIDGSNNQSIFQKNPPLGNLYQINIYNNKIYFDDIYAVRYANLSSDSYESISGNSYGDVRNFIIKNESIYYTNKSDNDSIYKMNIDGSNVTKINNTTSNKLNIYNDEIYYIAGNSRIYKINKDGENIKISDDQTYFFIVDNDWIYYMNVSDNKKLYKMKLDGTAKTKLNDQFSANINIIGDWVFYTSKGTRHIIKNDGSIKYDL